MSQTLKFGNGTWATKKGSTLAYNDEGGNFKPLPFTTTRSTSATRVNKKGLIEVVENDRPRIDYKDSEDGSLLLEPQRSNLITYSQDFSNAVWNTGSTRSVNFAPTSTIDPQGKTNAYRVTSTASDNQVAVIGSIVSGQIYTNSIYVRRVSGNGNVALRNVNNEENIFEVSVNDGWKRIETTATSTSTFGRLYINLYTVGDVIEIWGGQLEQGSYATSYIPTQGSATTRVQETASGSGNSEVFNDSEGVLFANIAANANDGTYRFLSVSAGAYANSIRIGYFTTPNVIEFRVVSGGTPQTQPLNTLSNTTIPTKIAGKYKQNDFALWVNGFEVDADANGNTPSGLSELAFDDGNSSNNSPFYGKTKEIAYYDTVLTDLELETLTSYRTWEAMVKELNLNIIHNE